MMRKEDDAVTSNGMNDNYTNTNNINSCSGSDINRNGDANQISQVWGTWEELLLTCAVKRHGSKDWDSVAKEVRSRSSLNASAHDCRLKYQDLRRRFDDDGGQGNIDDRDGEIVEQLRSLRVAELRREVQRSDESILSLQLKVKRLEEKDGDDGDDKPDLEDGSKAVRSLTEPVQLNRETTESDHRSMNESNSTASVDKIADHERLNGDNSRNPDPAHKAADEEAEGTVSRRSGMSHSSELGESGTSTESRKRTRRGLKYMSGEDSSIRGGSGGNIKTAGNKPQPLIEIIKLIRSHPRGSVFESRLRSQETDDYKGLIRQHLDIKTIEKKMEKGSYVSSSLSFYRDLKLLFTNAIVFFPTSSSEYIAAQELRTLVSNEMKKNTGKSIHRVIKADALSLVSKQSPSAPPPLVACKNKSSASKKTLPSSSLKQKDEEKTKEVSQEKTVTTAARSSRRTSKGTEVVAKDTKMGRAKNNKKQKTDSSSDDDGDKEETPKTEKKAVVKASEKKKSVAEFLKRIKTNSPQKRKETTSKDQKKSGENVQKENSKTKPRELRSNSTGKKKVEVENNSNKSSSKRKQSKKEAEEVTDAGRESGKDNQQPKKRSRR